MLSNICRSFHVVLIQIRTMLLLFLSSKGDVNDFGIVFIYLCFSMRKIRRGKQGFQKGLCCRESYGSLFACNHLHLLRIINIITNNNPKRHCEER